MKSRFKAKLWVGVMALLSLTSCQGLFENIYDAPQSAEDVKYGFIMHSNQTHIGRIYIDATDYAKWHYVSLSTRQVIAQSVSDKAPAEWDFAIHRYDVKTNGGAVAETMVKEFGQLPAVATFSPEQYVADQWTTQVIKTDVSQMMDGVIRYAEDYYNACISQWLHVDTSTMPPLYTLSGRIYLLRLSDGSQAALRLNNFMNDKGEKGYMTIDYQYPVE